MATATKTSFENKQIGNGDHFVNRDNAKLVPKFFISLPPEVATTLVNNDLII